MMICLDKNWEQCFVLIKIEIPGWQGLNEEKSIRGNKFEDKVEVIKLERSKIDFIKK